MNQSRLVSLIEQILNVFSGYVLAFIIWVCIIIPVFNIETTIGESMLINLVFTVISVFRGYLWRRLFINHLDRVLHNIISKMERGKENVS